ncbi:MAG: hypothetical protein ACOY0T_28385 [Myxococcota bacterium]
MASSYAYAQDGNRDRDRDQSPLVGAWQCRDAATSAPYLVTFHGDFTLRTSLPSHTVSDTHALWKPIGRNGFRVTGRGFIFSGDTLIGTGRSDATGAMTSESALSASVSTVLSALDGTVLAQSSFVLECRRLAFD